MSWFGRSFSLNGREEEERTEGVDQEDEEEEEEEEEEGLDLAAIASATGKGVKDDLSQLTKTFTRQLWGVASFLAPPPPERSDAAEEQVVLRSSSKDETTSSLAGEREASSSQSEVDSRERTLPGGESDLRVSSSPHKVMEQGSGPTTPRGGPRLTGLRSDFAELRGSVATGLSRISNSVIRVVAGDNSDEDEEEEASAKAVADNVNISVPSDDQTSKSSSRGFDAFLKPLLGNMLAGEGSHKGDTSDEEEDEEANTRKFQDETGSKSSGRDSLPSAFASGFDGISKFLLQIVQDEEYEEKEDELDEHLDAVGLSEAVVTFARNIAMHPETWLDFPLPEDESDDEFSMNNAQKEHAHALELAAPGLKALRIELCPNYMSEGRFWLYYFVLLHSRLNPEEAQQLCTPQVLSARTSMLRELQKKSGQSVDLDASKDVDRELFLGEIEPDVREAQPLETKREEKAVELPAQSMESLVMDKVPSDAQGSLSSSVQESGSSTLIVAEVKPVVIEHTSQPVSKFPMLNLEDDEAEVDEWLDDEPSSKQRTVGGGQTQTDLGNMDEDVSFSDFEDDDPSQKASGVKESDTSLDRETAGSTTKEVTVKEEKGDGAQLKNSERGDFNDWLTVDQEDVVSTSSSP